MNLKFRNQTLKWVFIVIVVLMLLGLVVSIPILTASGEQTAREVATGLIFSGICPAAFIYFLLVYFFTVPAQAERKDIRFRFGCATSVVAFLGISMVAYLAIYYLVHQGRSIQGVYAAKAFPL